MKLAPLFIILALFLALTGCIISFVSLLVVFDHKNDPVHVYGLPAGSRRLKENIFFWEDDEHATMGLFLVHSTDFHPVNFSIDQCCKWILDGSKINVKEGFDLDANNDGSLNTKWVENTFTSALSSWTAVLGYNPLGRHSLRESSGIVLNGRNQIALGRLEVDSPGALAITALWVRCPGGGTLTNCRTVLDIFEWDMTYNIVDYPWGDGSQDHVFDLLSIATHEFGHVLGLDDLYAPQSCSQSTMWGSSRRGETIKRSIDADTRTCIKTLYSSSGGGGGGEKEKDVEEEPRRSAAMRNTPFFCL